MIHSNPLIHRALLLPALLVTVILTLASCRSDSDVPDEPAPSPNHHTVLMYMPWSGDRNDLTRFFWTNISDMQQAYRQSGPADTQVIVFIQTSGTEGYMFNLSDYQGHTDAALATYQHYTGIRQTTAAGISQILGAMRAMAPADSSYAMTIGCHGLGWIPTANKSNRSSAMAAPAFRPHWDHEWHGGPVTRYFGGTSTAYQTDISTLAEAIANMGMEMEYILFDDCYMSSVEVAYDLRHVARHIIACPTEVMGDGMPYARLGRYLLGRPDYAQVVQQFYEYYSMAADPYGTIGVTDCAQIDSLARLMKVIHGRYSSADVQEADLQRMDGYTPVVFYDLGDYVAHQVTDTVLLRQFEAQLEKVVPYKAHTPCFPSDNGWTITKYPISAYSGITTSEPSRNAMATSSYTSTTWYRDTH